MEGWVDFVRNLLHVMISKTRFRSSIRQAMHETSLTVPVREGGSLQVRQFTGKERDT